MNNTASPWISIRERTPVESDWDDTHGVIYADENRATKPNQWLVTEYPNTPSTRATHWRRVELPPLPKPTELNQTQKDEDTINRLLEGLTGLYVRPSTVQDFRQGAVLALRSERAHLGMSAEQFVKELRQCFSVSSGPNEPRHVNLLNAQKVAELLAGTNKA